MRLVNMDVDRYGTQERCQLGPLSAGLNAICGPRGSGKTTLLHWLRQVIDECTHQPEAAHQPSWDRWTPPVAGTAKRFSVASGTVEIQNKNFGFRVTTDRNGRLQFDALGSAPWPVHEHRADQVLSNTQRQAFAGLATASGALDTRSALEQLAMQLGISQSANAEARHSRLKARQRDLELRLQRSQLVETRESLLARQKQLESELVTAKQQAPTMRYVGHDVERRRIEQRCSAIEADLRSAVEQIEELDRVIATKTNELELLDGTHGVPQLDASYREQLQRLDDRLNRWRQTLRDLKSHRETIEHNATDARLDKQIGDQLSSTKESDPRAAMRSLEAQILNTRQQLDVLVERYAEIPGYDYRSATSAMSRHPYGSSGHGENGRGVGDAPARVYRDASGRTYIGQDTCLPDSSILPETLRTMQKDLQEVCQQLARYESKTATETLRQQSLQLKRCEEELLQSVEKLIEERALLLRSIANEHHVSVEQLTLAFGDWCQCHDHPHLRDWLLSTDKTATSNVQNSSPDRQRLIEEVGHLRHERKQAALRADDCRRQLRDAGLQRSQGTMHREPPITSRSVNEIQREIELVLADLAQLSDHERTRSELEEIRHELRVAPSDTAYNHDFLNLVDRHIAALMPTRSTAQEFAPAWDPDRRPFQAGMGRPSEMRYDLVDGLVTDPSFEPTDRAIRFQVPEAVVRLAMRLAIGEALARRGDPVSLVLDELLDDLSPEIQRSTVAHLARLADHGQQVVLLTGDERVTDLVRSQRGFAQYMHARAKAPQEIDVNRQLAALANDHEADKWYQPSVQVPRERRSTSEYYLRERSLIEDLPSIEPAAAARCRALGVDRIGDLLDVDPFWLAENIRMDGVGHSTVVSWQAKARLLCGVRNLRPFDARVLVGVGIRSPRQLADMHPSELLERVERFLATDAGRRILQSGNSYELSRITSWIASAEGGGGRYDRSSFTDGSSSHRAHQRHGRTDGPGYASRHPDDSDSRGRDHREYGSRRNAAHTRSSEAPDGDSRSNSHHASRPNSSGSRQNSARNGSERSRRRHRSSRSSGNHRQGAGSYPVIDRDGSRSRDWERRHAVEDARLPAANTSDARRAEETGAGRTLRFYLELSSPIVDAPSIGPRGAAKLEQHGIITVADLLAANAESLASKLNSRKVSAQTVRAWQEQARLVCRIPNLRGHDAQLLVACNYTSPEELSEMDTETVLAAVLDIAHSKQGQRILRGGQEPDLDEVTDWITWAASCRSLNAA